MKKLFSLLVITLVIFTTNGIYNSAEAVRQLDCNKHREYCQDMGIDNTSPTASCNKKRTLCYIGNFRMQAHYTNKPLFVTNGGSIVCNYERTNCTDGYRMIKKSRAMF